MIVILSSELTSQSDTVCDFETNDLFENTERVGHGQLDLIHSSGSDAGGSIVTLLQTEPFRHCHLRYSQEL